MDDFNFPSIDWASWSSISATLFPELLFDLRLYQHVHFPTPFRTSQSSLLLDLVLTNEENMITNITSCDPLGKSDHIVIQFKYLCYFNKLSPKCTHYLYARGNYLSTSNEFSSINWIHEFNSQDISTMWEFCYSKYTEFTDKYIPSVNFSSRDPSRPLWLDATTLKLLGRSTKLEVNIKLPNNNQTSWVL